MHSAAVLQPLLQQSILPTTAAHLTVNNTWAVRGHGTGLMVSTVASLLKSPWFTTCCNQFFFHCGGLVGRRVCSYWEISGSIPEIFELISWEPVNLKWFGDKAPTKSKKNNLGCAAFNEHNLGVIIYIKNKSGALSRANKQSLGSKTRTKSIIFCSLVGGWGQKVNVRPPSMFKKIKTKILVASG